MNSNTFLSKIKKIACLLSLIMDFYEIYPKNNNIIISESWNYLWGGLGIFNYQVPKVSKMMHYIYNHIELIILTFRSI